MSSNRDETPRPDVTAALTWGLRRRLVADGFAVATEYVPAKGLRADVVALSPGGAPEIWIFEIKSSVADFRADRKWRGYLDYCDRFVFCVAPDFPIDLIPEDVGLWRADAYDAAPIRDAPLTALSPARRRAQILRVARDLAQRLARRDDPEIL